MADKQGVQRIIKGNGTKRGKYYKSLLDICPSGTKAEKEVGKNTGRSEERNKTTVIMGKNEANKFTRFDQRVLAEIERQKSGKEEEQSKSRRLQQMR